FERPWSPTGDVPKEPRPNGIITDADDPRFDHFWQEEALATLADLSTLAEMPAALSEVAEPRAPYDGEP
ncbi:MAG: hypothetical protein GY856_28960, partial [bacterium]|nr:hypothetical protein [bacterium]